MPQQRARLFLAALSISAMTALTCTAQAQQRDFRTQNEMMRASPSARIEPRIRSGTLQNSAAPLTIRRDDRRISTGDRWAYTGRNYGDRRYGGYERRDGNWFPGLIAAPFLLPWYLLGGGYDGGYGPYYEDPWVNDPAAYPAYPGPTTTFSAPLGSYCATPQKTCLLYEPAEVGLGCSCRAPAGYGRFRGSVVP